MTKLSTLNERELKAYLLRWLTKDFQVQEDVEGQFLVDGKTKVVIDYLMYPKPHLIERGFIPEWFGVEVKAPGKDAYKKGIRVAWQAITYCQSVFNGARPPFVVIFPPLEAFKARGLATLLQKANVGYIEIDERRRRWMLNFGATYYFDSARGLSKTPNAALKRNVGTWR